MTALLLQKISWSWPVFSVSNGSGWFDWPSLCYKRSADHHQYSLYQMLFRTRCGRIRLAMNICCISQRQFIWKSGYRTISADVLKLFSLSDEGSWPEGAGTAWEQLLFYKDYLYQMEAADLKEHVLHESSCDSTKIICIRWRQLTWRSWCYMSSASKWKQLVIFNILCIRWRQLIWTSRCCKRSASSSKRWISPLEPSLWDALRYSVYTLQCTRIFILSRGSGFWIFLIFVLQWWIFIRI